MIKIIRQDRYVITIDTTDIKAVDKLSHIYGSDMTVKEDQKELCDKCREEVVYAYASFGTIVRCNTCKQDNLASFPQCTRCRKNPKELMSSEGYCWSCILDMNPNAPEDSYIGTFRKALLNSE